MTAEGEGEGFGCKGVGGGVSFCCWGRREGWGVGVVLLGIAGGNYVSEYAPFCGFVVAEAPR